MRRFRGGTIGLDVDRGAIKAVQLIHGAEGYTLQHVGYHRLPDGAVVNGEVGDIEVLASEIQNFWNLHNFRGRSVVLGVAGSNVVVRFVDFPRLSPEDLESALAFQAEEHIPMPMEDVVMDHVVLGPSDENPEEDHLVLVAAHREMIGEFTTASRNGGLRLAGIDVKALSLTRSSLPEALFDEEETVVLLDVGTEISNLVIVQGTKPTLTQFLPVGFRDFSVAVAEAADIELDLAERQALNPRASLATTNDSSDVTQPLDTAPNDHTLELPAREDAEPQESEPEAEVEYEPAADAGSDGVEDAETSAGTEADVDLESTDDADSEETEEATEASGTDVVGDEEDVDESADTVSSDGSADEAATEELSSDPALMFDVRQGLEAVGGRLAEDVRRAIEYHDSRPRAREVTRMMLSGEGALVRGLDEYLGNLLGLRTEMARPTAKLVANRSNISDEQLAAMEPVLAVAFGLAMDET